ncbi:Uncharacterized protein APZ42_018268 [Daphnia magna]|uniref:Reverse transcriptase domain-containing protein n=1 Tax=Daphnia magna TaxID=35525 RepID=A0A164Z7R1_9CRUS|nr:Uncharacterized protein APZ42_018268 [Daphnia magna]
MDVAFVGVDFEKAYDLVNRKVLWGILDVISYPTIFVRWLQTMYSVTGMTILNGSESTGGKFFIFNRFAMGSPYLPISLFCTLSQYSYLYLKF